MINSADLQHRALRPLARQTVMTFCPRGSSGRGGGGGGGGGDGGRGGGGGE